jgi:hypothetical protein
MRPAGRPAAGGGGRCDVRDGARADKAERPRLDLEERMGVEMDAMVPRAWPAHSLSCENVRGARHLRAAAHAKRVEIADRMLKRGRRPSARVPARLRAAHRRAQMERTMAARVFQPVLS